MKTKVKEFKGITSREKTCALPLKYGEKGMRFHSDYFGWGSKVMTEEGLRFLPDDSRCYNCNRICKLNEN